MYDLNVNLPDITSETESVNEKFGRLKNYLFELTESLSVALSREDVRELTARFDEAKEQSDSQAAFVKKLKEKSFARFVELKNDIIRTATEIEQEYTSAITESEREILAAVASQYTAQSDFGSFRSSAETRLDLHDDAILLNAESTEAVETELETFRQNVNAEFAVQADSVTSRLENVFSSKSDLAELEERMASTVTQTVSGVTENYNSSLALLGDDLSTLGGRVNEYVSELDVYIRRGELESGVYGIEIGRSDSNIKARFTNDRLSFRQGDVEVAYISGTNLYITRAEVLDYLRLGNSADGYFMFDVTSNGLEVRWSDGD